MLSLQTLHSKLLPLSLRRSMSTLKLGVPKIKTVACVGLGLMGHGIAQSAATSNYKVIAFENESRFLDSGKARILGSLDKMTAKGKLTELRKNEILDNITYTTDIQLLKEADLVIEAVIENMDLKKEIYKKLAAVCKPEAIFASNTSSLSITEMGEVSGRPDRFVGVHFFNPVQLMKLVEVIKTNETHPEVFAASKDWVSSISKQPVSCNDTPGFIVNRLLVPSLTQAMLMVDRKDASITDIDISMMLGAGHPMGPLHLADFIGLDTCINIMNGWVEKFPNEPAFAVPNTLKERVARGDLGRKTGRGFYEWGAGDKRGAAIEE